MLASDMMYSCLVCGRITPLRVELDGCPPAPACCDACALIILAPCEDEIPSPPCQDTTRVEIVVPVATMEVTQ